MSASFQYHDNSMTGQATILKQEKLGRLMHPNAVSG